MSVDFYVAVPAANWPTAASVERCMVAQSYPVRIKRFPSLDRGRIVTDGALAVIDGKDAYLEGELSIASAARHDVEMVNARLRAAASPDTIRPDDALLAIHVRSPAEMRAASYVLSALIVCFDGFGFEPQGDTSGRAAFA